MKRRVVKHGPSTLIISLPAKWTTQQNIKRGDEVEVLEQNAQLIISPHVIKEPVRRIIEDVSMLRPRLVQAFLARSYEKGFDEVFLIHNNLQLLEVIRLVVQNLIGYELIEQDTKTCLIRSISNNVDLDFSNCLRKIFLLLKEMLSLCLSKDIVASEQIRYFEKEVSRLSSFCLRELNKGHYREKNEVIQTPSLFHLIKIFCDLGNTFAQIADDLQHIPTEKNDVQKALLLLEQQFSLANRYFYKATKEVANRADTTLLQLHKEIKLMKEEASQAEMKILCSVGNISHLIDQIITLRLDFLQEKDMSLRYFERD